MTSAPISSNATSPSGNGGMPISYRMINQNNLHEALQSQVTPNTRNANLNENPAKLRTGSVKRVS
jgi:hypothetical protein